MLLHDLIFDRVESHSSNTALVHGDLSLSYQELADSVARVASGLRELGVAPGERIAVYLNKRVETVVSFFGASTMGAVFVPVNPTLKATQVGHILRDCNVTVLVTTGQQAVGLAQELDQCPDLRNIVTLDDKHDGDALFDRLPNAHWAELAASEPASSDRPLRIDTDIAAILYTSGSTGKPKGVVLSHRNMVAGALSVAKYLENCSDDRLLAALPFSFDVGFSQLTTAFSVGASVILLDYLLPRDVLKVAARHRATGLAGVPPLWAQLAHLEWPQAVVDNLRYITNTGGAMPTATLKLLRDNLPNSTVFLMYGLTEAFRSTYLPPEEIDRRPTSIGKAIPNAEIMVVREDGTPCEPGEPGELVHRGALVSLGYWNDPERTAQRFKPAPGQPPELPFQEMAVWSGDTVVKDDDHFIYFVGRKDDMIKSSGYRISPTDIEEVVFATGLVRECAAIGIAHASLGQAVVVICYLGEEHPSASETILTACRKALPNYMVPSKLIFGDELPRNPNGKIDRKQLAGQYEHLFEVTQ